MPHVPAYELAEMVVEAFIKPDENGQRRRIVAAYLDPANFKDIGDGHTIADQINEVFDPWEITCERASNDRLGGWQLLYRMLRTGEFEITDVCPRTFEALRTRMHDDSKARRYPQDRRRPAGRRSRRDALCGVHLCAAGDPAAGVSAAASRARARRRLRRHSLATKGRGAGPGRRTDPNYAQRGIGRRSWGR